MTIMTLELDDKTRERLRDLAAARGHDVSTVVADAVALLDTVIDLDASDLAEDRRRLKAFELSGLAADLHDVRNWVHSWDEPDEKQPPKPHRIG